VRHAGRATCCTGAAYCALTSSTLVVGREPWVRRRNTHLCGAWVAAAHTALTRQSKLPNSSMQHFAQLKHTQQRLPQDLIKLQSLYQKPVSQPKPTVTPTCYLFHGQVVPD